MRALVCGGGGFIGGHLVKRLKADGHWVRGVDLKKHEFCESPADEFWVADLRDKRLAVDACRGIDQVYQLAADMGGAGFVFTGENDAVIMHNSATINLNMAEGAYCNSVERLFYSSSACIYPARNQVDPNAPDCSEGSAYPAEPDSEYGWEKLFSERMYETYVRNWGMTVRIARFHNIMGPEGTWQGGREKAPAAICRKVIEAKHEGRDTIEIWGDGQQSRSFCWIKDCVDGILRLMESDITEPLNIGSSELVTINELVDIAEELGGVKLKRVYDLSKPKGVRGRNSDNTRIKELLGWEPRTALRDGMAKTFAWIEQEYLKAKER